MKKAIVIFLKKLAYNLYSKLFITTDLGFYFFVGLFVFLVKTGYVYEAYMFDYSQLMVKLFLFIIDLVTPSFSPEVSLMCMILLLVALYIYGYIKELITSSVTTVVILVVVIIGYLVYILKKHYLQK